MNALARLGAKLWSLLWTPTGRRASLASALSPLALLVAVALWRSGLEAPGETLFVRDRGGRFLGEIAATSRPGEATDDRLGFWKLSGIPARVAAATIAIEDRRFRSHPGVDPLAIGRALLDNGRSDRRRSGASTLAMQVARLQHPGPRGYLRKIVEATTALAMTARYGRDAVLAHYLRIVPYGHRIHGIGFAARRYFDKPVDDLSWAEVAFLAAIPQAPAKSDPYEPAGQVRAISRGRAILHRLAARGELGPAELAAALAEIERIRIPDRERRPESALHPLLALAESIGPPKASAKRDAPLLDTTLDLDLQGELESLADRAVTDAADRGAGNAAILVVDRRTWEVLAAVGSTGYFDQRRAGAIDYLRLPRSSGSTLKPFLYAAALERRTISTSSILDDLAPGPGGILNSDDRFFGPMLPRAALANSRNVPAALLLARTGVDPVYALFGDLGLHSGETSAARYGLGLSIGSLPVTLEALVGAYTTLAGDGRLRRLRWFASDEVGASDSPAIFSAATARLLTQFLSDPQARLPTFPRMGFSEPGFPLAVKTGTSSRYRDAWTVAWSDRYLVGIWVGHPDERPMAQLSGARVAGRLAQQVFERLHRGAVEFESEPFPAPRGYRQVRLCALTGRRATAACDRIALEWVNERELPIEECAAHRLVAVDRRTGTFASGSTPPEAIEARSFVDLPSRYAAWAARQGLPELSNALAASRDAAASALASVAGEPKIEILSPESGARLLLDPEAPAELNSLALRAVVDPPVPQLLWFVDGVPVETVERPYGTRWRLARGEHVFEARVPFSAARSRRVRIVVD